MKDPHGLSRALAPTSYLLLLLELVADRGGSREAVIAKARLPEHFGADSGSHMTIRQWSRAILAAMEVTGDEGIGWEYGLRMRPTAHGALGFALMSAPTVGDALQLASRFLPMRTRGFRLSLSTEGEQTVATLEQGGPIVGLPPAQGQALRRFLYESTLLGLITDVRFLTGRELSAAELRVDWPHPGYHDKYQDQLPPVRFEQAANQILFPASALQLSILTADPVAYRMALAQCEQERARFDEGFDDTLARVKALLVLSPGVGFPSLPAVADSLNVSESTLKRRLQEQGLSFLVLLNEARQAEAANLLITTTRSVQEIADWLGYATPTNFVRAFRQWRGMTPKQYREHSKKS